MDERIILYRILVGKPEGKRPLGRPRRRWDDNIKMGLQEVIYGGMDWIDLGRGGGQVAGSCECGNEPSVSMNCRKFLDYQKTSSLLNKDCAPRSN